MFGSKYLSTLAACAALSVGSAALAADPVWVPASVDSKSLAYPLMMDDMSTGGTTAPNPSPGAASAPSTLQPRGLLMQGFDALGNAGSALDAAHLTFSGYVEGSWTYDFRPQDGNVISGRAYDTNNESLQFDAVNLTLTRAFDPTYKSFDVGFVVETMYGWDPAYFHSNGLSIYTPSKTASPIPGSGGTAAIHPKAQFDLTQAYATVALPVLNGVGIQFGKFDTLLRYESIDANASEYQNHPITFFSRSFIYQQEPNTHTGIVGIYNFIDPTGDDKFTFTGGITRGWDQSTNDDNGSIDYTGQFKYVAHKWALTFSGITGQEEPTPALGLAGLSGYRTVLDMNGQYNLADNLSVAADLMYGWENQTSEGGAGGGVGIWYAAAVYGSFRQSNVLTFNIRGEWFDDQDGAAPVEYLTSGFNGTYGKAIGTPNQYYEVTVGMNITPLPANKFLSGLHIRPEFRWDYSDHASWNGATQHDQWTAAVEAYFTF